MEFSRPEYWSEEPFLSPEDLPNPGIKHGSPTLWADSLPAEPKGKQVLIIVIWVIIIYVDNAMLLFSGRWKILFLQNIF